VIYVVDVLPHKELGGSVTHQGKKGAPGIGASVHTEARAQC